MSATRSIRQATHQHCELSRQFVGEEYIPNMPHEALDGYPIDEDYVEARSAEPQRADVEWDPDAEDDMDRSAPDDYSHQYSTRPGTMAATAYDEQFDEEAADIAANDGRSLTRTWFKPTDADVSIEREQQYWKLAKLNDGVQAPERSEQNYDADTSRWIDTICGRLELGDGKRDRIRHIVDTTRLRYLGGPYIAEEVILAAATIVISEDAIERREEPWHKTDETFQRLCDDIGTDAIRLRHIRSLLRDKSGAL